MAKYGIKAGVDFIGMHPKILEAADIISDVYEEYGYKMTITCGREAHKNKASYHNEGKAIDLRTREFKNSFVTMCIFDESTRRLKVADEKYQLVNEVFYIGKGQSGDIKPTQHFHVVYDDGTLQ